MVLLIIIPFLNGYFIGGIPHFQTYPIENRTPETLGPLGPTPWPTPWPIPGQRPELQAQVVDHSWPCQRFHGRKHWTFTEPISWCSNFCVKNTVEFLLVSKKRTMYRYLCMYSVSYIYIYTYMMYNISIYSYNMYLCVFLGLYTIPNSTSPRIPHTSRASSECLRLRCHWGNKGSFEWKPQTVGGLEKRGCSTFNVVSFKISSHRYGSGPKMSKSVSQFQCFTTSATQISRCKQNPKIPKIESPDIYTNYLFWIPRFPNFEIGWNFPSPRRCWSEVDSIVLNRAMFLSPSLRLGLSKYSRTPLWTWNGAQLHVELTYTWDVHQNSSWLQENWGFSLLCQHGQSNQSTWK